MEETQEKQKRSQSLQARRGSCDEDRGRSRSTKSRSVVWRLPLETLQRSISRSKSSNGIAKKKKKVDRPHSADEATLVMAASEELELQQKSITTQTESCQLAPTVIQIPSVRCVSCQMRCEGTTYRVGSETHFHPGCFNCRVCQAQLYEKEYFIREGHLYCETHYNAFFGVTCAACLRYVRGKPSYFQGGRYHTECFSCWNCHISLLRADSISQLNGRLYCAQCPKPTNIAPRKKSSSEKITSSTETSLDFSSYERFLQTSSKIAFPPPELRERYKTDMFAIRNAAHFTSAYSHPDTNLDEWVLQRFPHLRLAAKSSKIPVRARSLPRENEASSIKRRDYGRQSAKLFLSQPTIAESELEVPSRLDSGKMRNRCKDSPRTKNRDPRKSARSANGQNEIRTPKSQRRSTFTNSPSRVKHFYEPWKAEITSDSEIEHRNNITAKSKQPKLSQEDSGVSDCDGMTQRSKTKRMVDSIGDLFSDDSTQMQVTDIELATEELKSTGFVTYNEKKASKKQQNSPRKDESTEPLEPLKPVPKERLFTYNLRRVKGLDRKNLERHLTDRDFGSIFDMERKDFYKLPRWKQNTLKKLHYLF